MILLCGEIYPTTLKSIGYGFNFALGSLGFCFFVCFFCFKFLNLGSFLSPYVVDVSNEIGINPMLSIGIICFGGSFCILFLKETIYCK